MPNTLIVLKPSRFRRIPRKDWLTILMLLVVSGMIFIGGCSLPRLTSQNTRELTSSITASRIITNHSRYGHDTAILEIDGKEYSAPIKNGELRGFLEQHPTGIVRLIVTDQSEIVELEYDGTLYLSLSGTNTNRLITKCALLILSLLSLIGSLALFSMLLLAESIVILRKRPKDMKKHILIEK